MKRREPTILRFVSILYRYSHMYIARKLQPFGLAVGHHPFLLAVSRHPGNSQDAIAEHLVIDKGTTAKAIKALEASGFIHRMVDLKDRRAYKLFVTDKGKKMGAILDKVLLEWQETLFRGFTPSEKQLTMDLVKRMAENAKQMIHISEDVSS
ncbi:MAG: MarR family winged helix-turn-helix transcriptional regulator [Spirochaetes bacterium]|nr:MarR family winged helix-turn-helix transcriptional regulator [Spirochaetota bacterium]